MKKEAIPKMQSGSLKRSPMEEEALAKRKNFQQTHIFTEASSANLTVKGEGDTSWFRSQITSRTKATGQTKKKIIVCSSKLPSPFLCINERRRFFS
jgi:hypothetical protein